jgi:hypothetical protein
MVTNELIIERSIYAALLRVALDLNVTLNPDNYLPISKENQDRYEHDMKALSTFVGIFGFGNPNSKGQKITPRIVIELDAYYPGDIGIQQFMEDTNDNDEYAEYEYPPETKHTSFDIHLVANDSKELRLLHQIMYSALPSKGFIKPFLQDTIEEYLNDNTKLDPTGNLFLEIGNFYDYTNEEKSIIEKIYVYNVKDGLLEEKIDDNNIAPITDISVLLNNQNSDDTLLHIQK